MTIFGYGRVSTADQTTENQRIEIEAAGFKLGFWFEDEGVSGSVPALDRPEFRKLVERIRPEETLVVSKLDRLGRSAVDVVQTVDKLQAIGIKVVVLALGNVDICSPVGRLILTTLAAVAELERSMLIERTHAGLARARAEGKTLGRPSKTSDKDKATIRHRLDEGDSVSELARTYGVSRSSIIAIREQGGSR
jgi:putative DNA-invertase from lambdoid prophage Rac